MKRHISLILAVCMAASLFLTAGAEEAEATGVIAASDSTADGWIEIFNESYRGLEGLPPGWSGAGDSYIQSIIKDNAYMIDYMDSVPGSSTLRNFYKQFEFVLDKNEAKGTRLLAEQISGKFAIEMDIETDINADTSVNESAATYAQISFGTRTDEAPVLTNTLFQFRFPQTGSINITMPAAQGSDSAGQFYNLSAGNYQRGVQSTLRMVVDSEAGTFDIFIDDMENPVQSSRPLLADFHALFGAMRILTRQSTAAGSYVKIRGLRAYQIEDPLDEAFSQALMIYNNLPDTLTEEPAAVVDNVDVSALIEAGMSVTSTNEGALSSSGSVSRSNADTDVTLYAEYTVDCGLRAEPLVFRKAYDFTVLGDKSLPQLGEREVFNETYYGRVIPDGWKTSTNNYISTAVEDDALVVRHLTSNPDSSSFYNFYKEFEFTLQEDEDNNTKLLANQISGKFEIELDFEANISTDRTSAGTNMNIGFGTRTDTAAVMTNTLLNFRLLSNGSMQCTMPAKQGSDSAGAVFGMGGVYTGGKRGVLRLVVDPDNGTFDTYYNGSLVKSDFALLADYHKLFGCMRITFMQATKEGSYFKIYGLKVRQLEDSIDPAFAEAFSINSSLPQALVSDPKNQKEDIDVSPLTNYNVNITASNPDVITGSGIVMRGDFDDEDASLYAEYEIDSGLRTTAPLYFKKAYSFTVKASDSAEYTVIAEEYADCFDSSLWEFHETKATHTFGPAGLVLSKIGAAENGIILDKPGSAGIRMYKKPVDGTKDDFEELFDLSHSGVFELDLSAISNITGNHPAYLDIGYQNPITRAFTPYMHFKYLNGTATYKGSIEDIPISYSDVHGVSLPLKVRVNTAERRLSIWRDGILLTPQPIVYDSQGIEPLNAIRVIIDENSNPGDIFTLESAKFVRRRDEASQTIIELRNAGKELSVSDVTDTPDDIKGILKALPAEKNGIPIKWSVDDSDIIDIETGQIYRRSAARQVILSAVLTKDSHAVVKEFYLTANAVSDQDELFESAVRAFNWDKVCGQPDLDIRYDIDLPLNGELGSAISWVSSRPDIMSSEGKINKSALINEDTPIKLTATISLGEKEIDRTFEIIIKKRGWENVIIFDTPQNFAPYTFKVEGKAVKIKNDTRVELTVLQSGSQSGLIAVTDTEGNKIKAVNVINNKIMVGSAAIADAPADMPFKLSFVLLPDVNKIAILVNDEICADYVTPDIAFEGVSGVLCEGNNVTVNDVRVFMDDYGILSLNADTFAYMSALPDFTTSTDLTFITDSFLNVAAAWETDNTNIIAADGKIKKGDSFRFARVTLTLAGERAEKNIQGLSP